MKHLIKGQEDAGSQWPPPDFERQWSSSRLKERTWDVQICKSTVGSEPATFLALFPAPTPNSNSFQRLTCLKPLRHSFITDEHKDPFLDTLPSAKIMYHGWKKPVCSLLQEKMPEMIVLSTWNGHYFAKLFSGMLYSWSSTSPLSLPTFSNVASLESFWKNEIRYTWFCN